MHLSYFSSLVGEDGRGTIIHLSLWDSNVRSLLLFLSSVSGRSPPRAAGLRKVQVRPALLMSQPFILFLLATNPNLFSLSLSCKKTSRAAIFGGGGGGRNSGCKNKVGSAPFRPFQSAVVTKALLIKEGEAKQYHVVRGDTGSLFRELKF